MIQGQSSSGEGDEDPDYLPSRMVNEYVYCPRLFYLMHIEKQFADSIDTVDGRIIHRRVDSGNGGLPPSGEDDGQSHIPDSEVELDDDSSAKQESKRRRRSDKHAQPPTLFGEDTEDAGRVLGRPLKAKNEQDQEEHPRLIHARSITLSSEAIGVIAKLDLVETAGNDVTPVDYKRGTPRRNVDGTSGAWDPERVQLCLQGLVLRANGYKCDRGVLYFSGSKQRVTIEFDDTLCALTKAAVAAARQLQDSGKIPAPLVNSPKCPRCSLVGICLPDETRRLTAQHESEKEGVSSSSLARQPILVRPMITARDERRPLYFNTQGLSVGKQGEVLRAKQDGRIIQEIRLNEISQVNLFGNVQLTTQSVQTMLGKDVPVLYFTKRGFFYGISGGLGAKNILTRREQFRRADDRMFCLHLARELVNGKIRNQRTLLMRNHREPKADSLRQLKKLAKQTEKADSLGTLLGVEGAAARIYFQDFNGMLKVDASIKAAEGSALGESRKAFDFRGRNRRPPRDPVNALLSLAYSLLTKDCVVASVSVGLDPLLGFYHQIRPGKPALALDLMEPFRPLIADSTVLSAINNRMVVPDHFILAGETVVLSETGRRNFLMAYEKRMSQLVTHPLFDYRVSYRRLLEIQTRFLARMLTGEINDYPVFTTR